MARQVKLPDDKNPYGQRTPFDVLGVSPGATARELNEAKERRTRDLDRDNDYIRNREAIRKAYRQLKKPSSRLALEVFIFDPSVGSRECRHMADAHKSVSFDFEQILRGEEAMFSTEPDTDGPHMQRDAEAQLNQSLKLKREGLSFSSDPVKEALETIEFDR